MTRWFSQKEGKRFILRCEGHAGNSAACNYIGGVMYAFAGYVKNLALVGEAGLVELTIDEGKPLFLVDCIGGTKVAAAFDAAVIGLRQLEHSRPDALRMDAE